MAHSFSLRLPEDFKYSPDELDERAEQLGLSRSEMMREALEMMMEFDDVFFLKVADRAKKLNIPKWLFMQNALIEAFAKEAAQLELGDKKHLILRVGYSPDGKPVSGEEWFNAILLEEKQSILRQRAAAESLRKTKGQYMVMSEQELEDIIMRRASEQG